MVIKFSCVATVDSTGKVTTKKIYKKRVDLKITLFSLFQFVKRERIARHKLI